METRKRSLLRSWPHLVQTPQALSHKLKAFSLLQKSVLIREQDAELAGATDRPIVIQKSEEFPKLFHLFNLSTVVNLMPKPKTEDL